MRNNTFENLKIIIRNKKYNSKEEMLEKLDVFLMGDRITIDEYQVLVKMLEDNEIVSNEQDF